MFLNREEAGIRLASVLDKEKNIRNSVLIVIPRGGVVVGKVISQILQIPMEVLIVKKIGAPQNPELAIGATGADGIVFWDEDLIRSLKISRKEKRELLKNTIEEAHKRQEALGLKIPYVAGKTVIVVDDGVATGATAIASSLILKKLGSNKIILTTPVISKRTKKEIKQYFDKIIAVETPDDFSAVGEFYRDFPQVEDEKVKEILNIKK